MSKKVIITVVACVVALAAVIGLCVKGRPSKAAGGGPGAGGLVTQAKSLQSSGDLLSAKAVYQKLLADYPNNREIAEWQRTLEKLNIQLLFSPVPMTKSIMYEVKPGDTLEKIARDHKTTVEMIRKANGLANDMLFPGKKLKVWNAPFSIFVDKSQNALLLKCDEEVIRTYVVATGTNNSTPVGTFKIIEKIVNPPWYKDNKMIPPGNPENILGTRWMGLDKEGYGIHGTTLPQSLGKQSTAGCVRMANQEVEELFAIVPQGTEVAIVD